MSISLGTVALLALLATSAASYGIGAAGASGKKYITKNDVKTGDAEVDAFLDQMSESEFRSLLDTGGYFERDHSTDWQTLGGLLGTTERVNTERLLDDLIHTARYVADAPTAPNEADYTSDEALASRIAELTAPLDELKATRQADFQNEMRGLQSQYSEARKGILSSQYRQNAQFMDTMSSQMERSRRNALEAGASAGLRLADNINIMLSNQNKQSQTSLETSNQLAQMLLNQQAASRQARGDYNNYMMQDYSARNAARGQAYDEGYKQYQTAMSSYERDLNDWETAYESNPVADFYRSSKARERVQGKYGGGN